MDKLCIISWNEKKFWQSDVYSDKDEEVPTWFCTGDIGTDMFDVINKTNSKYPGITFHQGITGTCEDCQAEYIYHEKVCDDCEGIVCEP